MNICLDSSAWIEIFTGSPNANRFADAAESADKIIVPTIVIYEVRRYALARFGVESANDYWSTMIAYEVVDLDADLAAAAAETADSHKLALAEAIILTTSRQQNSELWTQDAHFDEMDGVRYFAKMPSA